MDVLKGKQSADLTNEKKRQQRDLVSFRVFCRCYLFVNTVNHYTSIRKHSCKYMYMYMHAHAHTQGYAIMYAYLRTHKLMNVCMYMHSRNERGARDLPTQFLIALLGIVSQKI